MRSVTVGTRTSASRTAATRAGCSIGRSVSLNRTSNSSAMRRSIGAGNLRVMITSGFSRDAIGRAPPQIKTILTETNDHSTPEPRALPSKAAGENKALRLPGSRPMEDPGAA